MSAATATEFEAGFYPDVPEQDYLTGTFGPKGGSVSASGLKTMLKAPALYKHRQQHPWTSDAADLGTAVHEELLGTGPGIAIIPPTGRKKVEQEAHKAALEQARAEGKAPITADLYERVKATADAVRRDPAASRLIAGDWQAEVSAYVPDEETGIWKRCRFDILRADNLAVDLKTARDASPGGFARACLNLGYHISAAYYIDIAADLGVELTDYAFLVVEPEPPYLVAVYRLDDDAIDLGRRRYREALQRYRDCLEADLWPGYPTPDNHTLSLPGYAYKEN